MRGPRSSNILTVLKCDEARVVDMSFRPAGAQDKLSAAIQAMTTGAPHREVQRLLVEAAAATNDVAPTRPDDQAARPKRLNIDVVETTEDSSSPPALPRRRVALLISLVAPLGATCFVYATGGGPALALTIGLAAIGGFAGARLANDRPGAVVGPVAGIAIVGSIAGYIVFAAFGIETTGGTNHHLAAGGEATVCYRGVCD